MVRKGLLRTTGGYDPADSTGEYRDGRIDAIGSFEHANVLVTATHSAQSSDDTVYITYVFMDEVTSGEASFSYMA